LKASSQLALGGAAYFSLMNAHAQPSYKVSAEQLQQAVAKRFPRKYPVGGLIDLNLLTPQLRMLPEQNRLGVETVVEGAGPALRRSYAGVFDLDFALRYEASDLTIRASQLRVNSLRFDGLPPGPSALLSAYGPSLAEQTLQGVVLHQLKPQDLALPDGMGLQPGSITVTASGLVIGFVNKIPAPQPQAS
jgi:hypothetical protein